MDSNSYLGVSIDFQGVCVCVKYEGLRYQVDRGKRQEVEKHLGDIFWQILFCDTFTIDILLCILLSCPADWSYGFSREI